MDTAGNKENGMVISGTGEDMNNSGTPVEGQDDQANEVERIDKFARSEIFVQRWASQPSICRNCGSESKNFRPNILEVYF